MTDKEKNQDSKKTDAGKIFLEEVSKSPLTVTILAIVTGLLLGGILVALTTEEVYTVSYLIPTEEITLAEQYRMRKAAVDKGKNRAAELWGQKTENLTARDANYVTDFLTPAAVAVLTVYLKRHGENPA